MEFGQAARALTKAAIVWLGLLTSADAQVLAPPANLSARDKPNDAGTAIILKWRLSPDDRPDRQPRVVKEYEIFRTPAGGTERESVGTAAYGATEFTDQQCAPDTAYLYEVETVGRDGVRSVPAVLAQPVRAVRQWFDRSRGWFFVLVLLVCGAVVWFTRLARSGKNLYIREIAGLSAISEAVGRATEMGRPCLFVPGILDMNEIATVAGINVLSHVAQTVADYDTTIAVPTSRSLVMTAAREAVQAACLAAGRPEAYDENLIYYVTDEQFAYVAHVTGYMVRERPAACFYAGTFFAESLILAETGNSIGALQIAGTAEASQLPFFVAACDYTLIGEELFAASAYLSGEPDQLGSLKGQDFGKLLAAAILLAGCALATWGAIAGKGSFATLWLAYLRDTILGRGGLG
jgi:hypothetical protein